MKKVALLCAIAGSFLVLATGANAYSAYDGSWNLVFVTRSGACDATYNFTVDISNGVVYLASDESRYVTGVTLPIDAGFMEKV